MLYRRIAIIGSPGSGKTTFAVKLHEILGLPLYHLDRYFRVPDEIWDKTDYEDVGKRMRELADRDEWIIDGNYNRTMDIRLKRADFVIYFSHPTKECLKRARQRFEETKGQQRFDQPIGMIDYELDQSFMDYIKTFKKTYDRKYLAKLRKMGIPHIVLRTDEEGDAFLEGLRKV